MKTLTKQLVKTFDDETREAAKKREAAQRLVELKEGKNNPIYAVATRTFRLYGGPQEGGWWYDRTTIEEVKRCWNFKTLLSAVKQLIEDHPTDRYGRSSVLGNSGDVIIFITRNEEQIEDLEDKDFPKWE